VNDALAGLPYAFSSGRTAITWLWERGQKDPPPEPRRKSMTGPDVAEAETVSPPEEDMRGKDAAGRPAPAAPPPEPSGPSGAGEAAPEHAAGTGEPMASAEPAEQEAAPDAEPPPPPPAPRRRKGQRRPPVLDVD
jgi:hypothetical protein